MAAQRIVVLGGTGFVGHHLLARLARDGHQLIVLSRNREKHRDVAVIPGVHLLSADVHDPAQLRGAFAGAEDVAPEVSVGVGAGVEDCVDTEVGLDVGVGREPVGVGDGDELKPVPEVKEFTGERLCQPPLTLYATKYVYAPAGNARPAVVKLVGFAVSVAAPVAGKSYLPPSADRTATVSA